MMTVKTAAKILSAIIAVMYSVLVFVTPTDAHAHPLHAKHIVVSVDGTKGPGTSDSVDPGSPLAPLVDTYMSQHPDALKLDLRYPGGMIAGVWGWNVWFDDSVAAGKSALRQLVHDYESRSDNTIRWTFIGYSQGAIVAGDVASEIDLAGDPGLQQRTEAILYSDPRQPGTGIETRLPGYQLADGITFAGPRMTFQNVRVVWRWVPGDTIADSPPLSREGVTASWVSAVVSGYMLNHTSYRYEPAMSEMHQP